MPGRFITFEGGEGTGKSTQAALLARRLKTAGVDVLVTREPGGSPGAEAIRHVLLSGVVKPLGAHAEAILFAAARDDHVRETIRPALQAGRWVICDRFADSTRVYQGVLGNVDAQLLSGLERVTIGETRPHLTLVLDISPKIGLARAAHRRGDAEPDRYEAEAFEFHERLRAAYRDLAKHAPDRCVLVDVTGRVEHVAEIIWEHVSTRLASDLAPAPAPAPAQAVAS
jgi:dTMP kinase